MNSALSFVRKFVAQEAGQSSEEDVKTIGDKVTQTFKTVTSNVKLMAPAKITPMENIQPKESAPVIETPKAKTESDKPAIPVVTCRVCLKSIKPDDFSKTCYECQRKVCEDCASYSTTATSDDSQLWCCSVCRRKLAPRDTPAIGDLTEGSLEVPMPEGLQRRHSDARLSSQAAGLQAGGLGAGLVPPRSPDLRRHSDVSPASLKELEKFRKVTERKTEDWEWRSKSRSGSPERHQERDRDRGGGGPGGGDRQRTASPQRTAKFITDPEANVEMDRSRRSSTVRRKSYVTRQHSYDDEVKPSIVPTSAGSGLHSVGPEPGLGPPMQTARRASITTVFTSDGPPGLGIAKPQHRASFSIQGTRDPLVDLTQPAPSSRRPSFRAPGPIMPYEMAGPGGDEKMINLDTVMASEKDHDIPMPDEASRTRRRRSVLPDLDQIRAAQAGAAVAAQAAPIRPGPVARVNVDERELARQGSLADGEAIKIVIHDVDCDMLPRANSRRKVVLRKDIVVEKGHRMRSFGMRVVGGKIGSDKHLYAIIVWTVSGGPADKAGLQQGDKVLEWCGVSLIDRTFEEVAHIIDRSGDVAELVIEHTGEISGDQLDEPGMVAAPEKTSGNLGLSQLESETNKAPASPTRRKLPKTPEQLAKERQVTGRVQIHVWYETDRKELVVSVLAADDLCAREDMGYGTAPEAFAKLDLVSPTGDVTSKRTDVAEPTHNPIWNATLNFPGVSGEQLIDRMIEVTLWDYISDRDGYQFLGGCSLDLTSAFESDRAVWYRLEDPRGLRSGRSPHCSPRGSLSIELAQRLLRRTDIRERSYSDDTQSDSGSPEPYFLHPDHAWVSNSRRGSSQSEQLEIEPYELSKDYSRSLPGSRRSSFQSQVGGTDSKRGSLGEADVSAVHYNRERRRSSFARPMRDQDEILETLRNLKAQGKGELSRTMSLSGEKKRPNRRSDRRESSVLEMKRRNYDQNSESDEDEKWSQSLRGDAFPDFDLGPGQVAPKDYKVPKGQQNGKVQLAVFLTKGNLEVEVIAAKDICPPDAEEPDTYIKTYLRAEERWLHKRKTKVVRHSRNPEFRQTLKYSSCDALGRNLLVMLWEKKQGFGSNQGLGGAEIELDALALTRLTVGWYHLFPIYTLGTQNADSP